MQDLIKECGLNFDDYILHEGKSMKVDMSQTSKEDSSINIGLKGMVTYDKLKLIKDMTRGTKIQFGIVPKKEILESEFDLIIDSTGFHRNYLPRPQKEMWIPCIQYKVKYQDNTPFDDFYLKAFPSMKGYFWYFPLENGYAHIGAGDYERKNNNAFVDKFLKKHKNIKAYFHGHSNWNEFYTYRGPDNDVDLPTFRVDSPMKGKFSAKDETKLSFQLLSFDPKTLQLTVRECLWNTRPNDPKQGIVFGQSTTISLRVN